MYTLLPPPHTSHINVLSLFSYLSSSDLSLPPPPSSLFSPSSLPPPPPSHTVFLSKGRLSVGCCSHSYCPPHPLSLTHHRLPLQRR